MAVSADPVAALRWDGTRLDLLDQTLLPHREEWVSCTSAADAARAIRRLAIRGAPNLGIAGAYGAALEVARTSLRASCAPSVKGSPNRVSYNSESFGRL